MRATFSKVVLFSILFSQVTVYGQSASGTYILDPVTVDFASTTIIPGVPAPGYSGTVEVDQFHKLQILCAKNQDEQTSIVPCIKNSDGALVLGNASLAPYVSNSGAVIFDPPAVSVSGLITGEIGSSSLSPRNILQVAIDDITLLLKNNPPRQFSYPFSYTAPEGIKLLQLSGFFTQTIAGILGDPNAFYKVGLKTLTWSTKQTDLSLEKVVVTPSQPAGNDKPAVKPDVDVNISVTVKGSGFRLVEDRSAIVSVVLTSLFEPNKQKYLSQTIPLLALASSSTTVINFKTRFDVDDVGQFDYVASVDLIDDINITNNSIVDKMYVYCNVETKGIKEVRYFPQGSPGKWAGHQYADHPVTTPESTMGFRGCYTTNIAMLMDYYGIKTAIDGSPIDPGSVNKGLNANGFYTVLGPTKEKYNGYDDNRDVIPMGAVHFARASYVTSCMALGSSQEVCLKKANEKISFTANYDATSNFTKNFLAIKEINKNLCAGTPVILRTISARRPNNPNAFHFVLAKGTDVDRNGNFHFVTNDPISSRGANHLMRLDEFRGYRIYKQIADPSMIYFALTGGLNMVVTDPLGIKAGYNPYTDSFFNEGDGNASYTPLGYIDSSEGDYHNDPGSSYSNTNTVAGEYSVEIFSEPGAAASSYSLTRYSYDINGNINAISEVSGTILAGQSVVKKINHSQNVLPIKYADLKITKALFFDSYRKDKAVVIGKIITADPFNISVLKKSISVDIGGNLKSIEINNLKKIKEHDNFYYTHVNWGRRGLVFQINIKTGDFIIYVDNIDLDDTKPSLTTNITLKIDDLIARGVVTFKDVKRRKHDHR